ncbi:MAG: metallophosphoesterase [Promethearchaeota archaeon]|nr:MAG: metallophosphoesterase [Candidatus Lokiarchaeota archaeon]
MKYGILSDTHIYYDTNKSKVNSLLKKLGKVFDDVEEIFHAGDVCDEFFINELSKIAPVKCVSGNMDNINDLESFLKFSIQKYNIGLIHEPPYDLENFFKTNKLQILIHGHTHRPLIKGTPYNTLILNPGSPTRPKAPKPRPGFKPPKARPSVIIMEIDKNSLLKTFLVNI